jgi:hypothetical protein
LQYQLQSCREKSLVPQAAALDAIPDEKITGRFTIKFQGQSGTDAGGLTEDWLSLFMIEALDPYNPIP